MLVYFESDMGCGIRYVKSEHTAEDELKKELGQFLKMWRPAKNKDINWVGCMGGRIPKDKG